MGTAASGIGVSYRPVRFGWCVRHGHWDDLRRALRLTHTLWGGRFNPIIPIDELPLAEALVRLFRVDILYPVADANQLNDFTARFPWLPWPDFRKELFTPSASGPIAGFLDIYHVVRHIFEDQIKDKPDPKFSATQFQWDDADPLGDVFLSYLGTYPPKAEIGKDYFELVEKNLRGSRTELRTTDELNPVILRDITPNALTTYDAEWDSAPNPGHSGIYVGNGRDFDDIVNFWNLRASDAEVVFYDPEHRRRLEKLKDAFAERFKRVMPEQATLKGLMSVWSKEGADVDLSPFKLDSILRRTVSESTWNGYNLRPTQFHIGRSKSTLATVTDDEQACRLYLQLPEKPFFDEPELHRQKAVAQLSSLAWASRNDETTFNVPYLPALNPFCGRRMHFDPSVTRVQPGSLAIIESIARDQVHLTAIPKRELMTQIFEISGMRAEASPPGRIASRLIAQMGGIQGCRVFKIPGVRDLLEEYGPQDSFERTDAIQRIGRCDPVTGVPNFSDYESLFIEYREHGPLKPEHAFLYLIKRGVFQVGLELCCPYCELDSWTGLDDVASEVKCPHCGRPFLSTPQLRDRNWKYRPSGLFGTANNQAGSLPVILTLQQLDTVLSPETLFVTNMNIRPTTASIERCETDFALVCQHSREDKVSIAIGECKTRLEISEDDVRKLGLVADAFEEAGMDSFIVLAKLAAFTPDEIARCARAQSPYRMRVIMLTDRELEPYSIYERTEKEFQIDRSAISLEDLAEVTDTIYFHPRPKPKPAEGSEGSAQNETA